MSEPTTPATEGIEIIIHEPPAAGLSALAFGLQQMSIMTALRAWGIPCVPLPKGLGGAHALELAAAHEEFARSNKCFRADAENRQRIEALERLMLERTEVARKFHAEKDERIQALERFAAEQDRIVGRRDGESGNLSADVRHLFDALDAVNKRVAVLEAYELDREKADPPIDATAPAHADPVLPPVAGCACGPCCEKQDARDRRQFQMQHTETYLERHNREREEAQKARHEAQLSEGERQRIKSLESEVSDLKGRLPYKPGFVDS